MWKFEFQQPVGKRILNSRFIGVTNFHDLWWCYETKSWKTLDECEGGASTNFSDCRSFKAFKRHLNKHPELKTIPEVILCSRFVGYDIIAKWEE